MVLDANIPRVIFQFNDLHTLAGIVLTDEIESSFLQPLNIVWVNFIAMSMPLFNNICKSI